MILILFLQISVWKTLFSSSWTVFGIKWSNGLQNSSRQIQFSNSNIKIPLDIFYIFLGNNVEAMLSYHEYRMLEKDNPNFDPEAKDQNKYSTTCNPGLYDSCMYQQLEKSMMAEVGCTVPYLPNVDDKICTTKVHIIFFFHLKIYLQSPDKFSIYHFDEFFRV